ncbi:MAG: hypothetical protein JSW71_16650 [Gemmatimonadota bacterium]|nr:MAG: hypothetical protein JSW71_16650 [Gemmatimonadota bacterium]
MRSLTLVALLALAAAPGLQAQQGQMRQRQILQQQVMQRYMANYRQQAGLSDEQFELFSQVVTESTQQRRDIELRERELWRAIEGQMRPGIAADVDSLNALMDSLIALQQERVDLARSERERYAEFLDPVQQAQLLIATRRLQNNIQQIIRGRQVPGGVRNP